MSQTTFSWWSRIFKRKYNPDYQQIIDQQNEVISNLTTSLTDMQHQVDQLTAKKEPECVVTFGSIEHDQVKLALDWNDEFIAMLRDNGYTGTDDEQLVEQYVATIVHRLVSPSTLTNHFTAEDVGNHTDEY